MATEIRYNPSFSVKKNAKNNGVSEATIRHYIRENAIDRRFDKKIAIIEECRKYLKKHPNCTKRELCKKTGHSASTIHQYKEYIFTEKEYSDFDKQKVQKRMLRQRNNFYATHPSCTWDILREEKFGKTILEPFCGSGSMAEVIKESGREVDAYDIVDRGYGEIADFFQTDFPKGKYDIITNPPYDEALITIIKKLLRIYKKKVALLLPIIYLNGKERYEEIYSQTPPARVYFYTGRITIAKNADFEKYNYSGANMTLYAWFIWERGHKGGTELKWIHNDIDGKIRKLEEERHKISALKKVEQRNRKHIKTLPCPTLKTLTRMEEYDAAKYLVYPFRGIADDRKLGNMSGGFPFKMQGVDFLNSEAAYICGLFSNNSKEHIDIQKKLIGETNGKKTKSAIRARNEDKGRKDWNSFNQQWMLYVVWQKILGNKDFQTLLLSVPDGAVIIEDTNYQNKPTSTFWGAKSKDRKTFDNKVRKYIRATGKKDDLTKREVNTFIQYGIYKGCNVMGKILTICRKCLVEGTEPDIDYDLLKSKKIFLLGKPVDFVKKAKTIRQRDDVLLGVIAGDMIGKPYERKEKAIKTTDFQLFNRTSKYTDDSVLTIAVADWLLSDKKLTWEVLAERFVHYGTRYRIKGQDRCFSKDTSKWLFDKNRPFGKQSKGNGAAMRVAPVGWFYDSVEKVEEVAKIQASLTHNTPEAIEGAQVTAVSILLSRQGKTKEEIRTFIESRYGWSIPDNIADYRKNYKYNILCKETTEGALVAFLSSSDFESAIRNAVSLGSDSDTLAAITGSIAEAFYGGVPEFIKNEVLRRAIPDEFKMVLRKFNHAITSK